MKTKQTILKAFASVALALSAFASADAQQNLGADCGCPLVADRTTVTVGTGFPGYTAVAGTYGGELTQGANFTCNNTYILTGKIYIPAGKTLNIAPGTVIKGALHATPAEASALIIERGGKIYANGTEFCPIVFTAFEDPMNGTYSVSNVGMWGGVVLLGKASNNLKLSTNGPFVPGGAGKLAVADGLGTVEGFASSNPQDQYGVATTIPVGYVQGTSPASTSYNFTQEVASRSFSSSTNLTTIVLSANNSTYPLNGMTVTGNGVAVGTVVVSASSSGVVLSGNNPIANIGTGTGANVTFTGTYPLPASTTGLFWAGSAGTGVTAPNFTSGTGPIALGGTNNTISVNYAIPFITSPGGGTTFDDDDDSGVMKYVSIRHSGAILAVGAEINGLTLASVGRRTTIDHIEIVSCADDNIEIFGGTVNLKYITTIFGNDDMFDYDLGWTGKAQFMFGMKNTTANASPDNDNGIEADSDDNQSNIASVIAVGGNVPRRSHPVMYNFTILGNGKVTSTSDNRGLAGACFKEGAEGELYNSIFANFKNGINIQKTTTGRTSGAGFESYHNWSTDQPTDANANAVQNSLLVKCNHFIGCTNNLVIDAANSNGASTLANTTANNTQFASDLNVTAATLTGFNYNFTIGNNNAMTAAGRNDVTPNPAVGVSGCPTAPVDGFFEPAAYRGAFSSQAGDNWLSNWSYSNVLGATQGVSFCRTDLNKDGVTNVTDFLIELDAFGTTCQ
jgi:hypothetical protein